MIIKKIVNQLKSANGNLRISTKSNYHSLESEYQSLLEANSSLLKQALGSQADIDDILARSQTAKESLLKHAKLLKAASSK